jgi:hypothetical protein
MLLGAIFCSIPMRQSDEVVTLVPGAVIIACGFAQLIIGSCVAKVSAEPPTSAVHAQGGLEWSPVPELAPC